MRRLASVVLLATGLGMALPGVYLALLGGSWYYLVCGSAVTVSALLIWQGRRSGLYLFWLACAATLAWSLWEAGPDGWALMPRLTYLAVLFLLLLPLATPKGRRYGLVALALAICGVAGWVALADHADQSLAMSVPPPNRVQQSTGEWTSYGANLHGTRYSPLAQITPANADRLEQAWVYHAGLTPKGGKRSGGLEVTPLMVDGTLYGCTAYDAVFALDPVTGKQRWRNDPPIDFSRAGHAVCRGVAFFRAPPGTPECSTRILVGTADNRLIALDARTGAACRDFGDNGSVDLNAGLGKFPPGWTNPTSPPVIVNGTAVIGAFIADNQSTHEPPGVVRGFDAVTGALKWAFDPGRPNDHGALAPGQTYVASTPNSWGALSADSELGLVYLPMGNGSPDFYGANRTPNTDHFSSAVVALDANTGAVRWVFQTVHHDLWDYDLAAQPVLADFPTESGPVPALIQATKTGQIFVLDRRDGHPLTKVEEKPVPASPVPGERWSRTQPFSTGMPSFAGPKLTGADMWGITPFDQLYCRIRFQQARYDGIYTPPGLGYSIRLPGELGGIDWGGVSVDESRGIMIVNSNRMADWDQFIPRAQADREGLYPRDGRQRGFRPHGAPGAAMEGTPYGVHWHAFLTGLGIPCQEPGYGFLSAVDLKTQKILWQRRFGDAWNSGPFGIPLHLPIRLGAPNIGGSLVAGGGLVFIGASQDKSFRVIDEFNGRTLWKVRLPAGGHATPMTYRGRDQQQYVLIAAGGDPSFGTGRADALIAYRLKR